MRTEEFFTLLFCTLVFAGITGFACERIAAVTVLLPLYRRNILFKPRRFFQISDFIVGFIQLQIILAIATALVSSSQARLVVGALFLIPFIPLWIGGILLANRQGIFQTRSRAIFVGLMAPFAYLFPILILPAVFGVLFGFGITIDSNRPRPFVFERQFGFGLAICLGSLLIFSLLIWLYRLLPSWLANAMSQANDSHAVKDGIEFLPKEKHESKIRLAFVDKATNENPPQECEDEKSGEEGIQWEPTPNNP